MSGEIPELDLDQEMDFEDFVSAIFPGFEIESVVMPVTGERIAYVDGKEQAQPADADGGNSDRIQGAGPGSGDDDQTGG